ncbi:MAG: IS1634 family transposase [Deltaproteobacteria bacterium]|nr:IS1634 family transposase [Deltaproteobacteria bacterium]
MDRDRVHLPRARHQEPQAASYKAFETTVTLYGTLYRAVVIHSDAYDERRRKRVTKRIDAERHELLKLKKQLEKIQFACLPDAEAVAQRITPWTFHQITIRLQERPVYYPGRPQADGVRRLKTMRYGLLLDFSPHEPPIQQAREAAGCFVLLSNTLSEGTGSISAKELLTIYSDQHMVERNFAFLKDPVFVNSLFLKSPRRIEALGLVFILALLIWRLME